MTSASAYSSDPLMKPSVLLSISCSTTGRYRTVTVDSLDEALKSAVEYIQLLHSSGSESIRLEMTFEKISCRYRPIHPAT